MPSLLTRIGDVIASGHRPGMWMVCNGPQKDSSGAVTVVCHHCKKPAYIVKNRDNATLFSIPDGVIGWLHHDCFLVLSDNYKNLTPTDAPTTE